MKSNRLNLIAEICAKRGMGPKILGIVAPTKADKREEIALNVATDDKVTARGEDMKDSDLPSLASSLPFESARDRGESESEILLSKREKMELRADLLAYRMAQDAKRARESRPFALALA